MAAEPSLVTAPQALRRIRPALILAARLACVALFGYGAFLIGTMTMDVTTSPWAPPEPPGTYGVPLFVGFLGLLVDIGLLYGVTRVHTLVSALGWLLGGVAVMVAILWLFLASDPLFGPGGPCSFDDPLHVSCWATAPQASNVRLRTGQRAEGSRSWATG